MGLNVLFNPVAPGRPRQRVLSTFYQAKGLEFSSRIHNILYDLDISFTTTTNISKYTDTGNFYLI